LHRLLASKGVLAGAEVRDFQDTLRKVFAPRAPRCAERSANGPTLSL
jgi:hypothetical protein